MLIFVLNCYLRPDPKSAAGHLFHDVLIAAEDGEAAIAVVTNPIYRFVEGTDFVTLSDPDGSSIHTMEVSRA
jgi:hypothetical protein